MVLTAAMAMTAAMSLGARDPQRQNPQHQREEREERLREDWAWLVRFRQDVISLRPAVVVILAGTNDIAGNTGPSTLRMIEDNLESMVELARANGIRVVLCSVLPAYDYPWRPGLAPAQKIVELNDWIRQYSAEHEVVFVDYHTPMANARQGLRSELSEDGVHPNEAGYRVMAPLVERGIEAALAGRAGAAGSRVR
jgi:lysophospholipase L1-like esterase